MYAVIELKGHQYIVNEWDTIVVDNMDIKEGEKVEISEVLSVFDEKAEKVLVWTPYVKGAKVSAQVKENKKWEKINVLKFKRKVRYTKRIWFRPYQTVLEVKKIQVNG